MRLRLGDENDLALLRMVVLTIMQIAVPRDLVATSTPHAYAAFTRASRFVPISSKRPTTTRKRLRAEAAGCAGGEADRPERVCGHSRE